MVSLSIYSAFMEKEFIRQAYVKTNLVSDRLASTLQYPLWYFAKNQAISLLESELKDNDISKILLFDETGELIGTANSKSAVATQGKPAKEEISTSKIVAYDSLIIGRLAVYADMAESRKIFSRNLYSAIVLACVIAGMVALVLYLSTDKLVTRKIMGIGTALEAFSGMNYKTRVTITGTREISALADAFNTMAAIIEHNNSSLEEIVKDRTGKLIEAEKLALIGSLVAGVAHEVNTPLGVSITATSHAQILNRNMLQACRVNPESDHDLAAPLEETGEALDISFRNLRRASDFINTFKKIAADQSIEEKRDTKIKIYIEDVLLSLKPTLKKSKHRITLACSPDLRALIIPGLLYQILTNLIINSLKHGFVDRDAGAITITVEEKKEGLMLFYEDNGRGVPQDIAERIFDPFFTTTRDNGGTGLGLYIIKSIMTGQGGDVSYQERVGGGAMFILRFPCTISSEGAINAGQ